MIYIGDHTRISGRHIDGNSVSADIARPTTRAITALDFSALSPGHMQDATLALLLQGTQESPLLPQTVLSGTEVPGSALSLCTGAAAPAPT